MTNTHVEPPIARRARTGAKLNISGGLAVGNMLAAVIAWVGYAQTRDSSLAVTAGLVTVMCVVFGVSYFLERIKALEQTVEELRTAQE